jgi:hypothetical protein
VTREQEYKRLANSAFKLAAEEESAQLMAQWRILGARYLELAGQSKKIDENEPSYDPIPWDRLRSN